MRFELLIVYGCETERTEVKKGTKPKTQKLVHKHFGAVEIVEVEPVEMGGEEGKVDP